MSTSVIKVRREKDVQAAAEQGAKAISGGQIVAFATETVYGLAAAADNAMAMERLRQIKSRPDKPFSVHVPRSEDVYRYVQDVPPPARQLIGKVWPGPVTLILPTGGKLADKRLQAAALHDVLCSEDKIGLRCPEEPVALAMLAKVGSPVVAPSANLAGEPSPRTADDVLVTLADRIDLLIDSGPTRYGKDSTIVACEGEDWRILREGVFDERTIKRLMKRRIVFTCTGNTCRSPIAVGLAKKLLAKKMDTGVSELRKHGIEITSAGIYASDGLRATPEAILAARHLGADISHHRSRRLTMELINSADLIFCMTEGHVDDILRICPSAADKVRRLDPDANVTDPIGGGAFAYRLTAQRIDEALRKLLDEGSL